jgi:diguanylate cyclase (GGDEF)-like protein/PAS domain S-box-containing protein
MKSPLRLPGTLHGRMALAFSLLLFFAATVISLTLATRTAQNQLQAQQRLGLSLIGLLENYVEQLAQGSDLRELDAALGRVGADLALGSIRITDAHGKVLYARMIEDAPPSTLTRLIAGVSFNEPRLGSDFALGDLKGRLEVTLSYRLINETLARLAFESALLSGAVLLITIILAYSLLTRFTTPLKPLTEFARQVSRGNWLPQVKLLRSGSREIQELNQAFTDGSYAMQHYIRNLEDTRELLAHSETRLRRLIDSMHEILFELDAEGRITFVNPAWTQLTGFEMDEALGRRFGDYLLDEPLALAFLPNALDRLHERKREVGFKTRQGRIWVSLDADAHTDPQGAFAGVVGTMADITQQVELNKLLRRYQDELYQMSVTDPLTGLYNRRHFDLHLDAILADHLARNQSVCLLMIDLDRFKFINDTYGHPLGDEVLRTTAKILTKVVRREDYVARLAGDEFAMVLKNTSLQEAAQIAAQLHATISGAYIRLPVGHLQLQSSIGAAVAPTHGKNAQELVAAADVALYQSKRRGRNRIEILAPDISKALMVVFSQGFQLRQALESGNIKPAVQPIFDMRTGRPIAYEVLARMRHEDSIVSAEAFIGVAEELGLTREVDLHIIRQTLRHAPRDYALFLNLSLSSFSDRSFVRQLGDLIAPACNGGRDITIEITERATAPITDALIADIQQLRQCGCKLALDDFGSGYSTYNFLSHFHPEYLKIEGAFVRGMMESDTDHKIVKHIHELARAFGMTTIAESVENEHSLAALLGVGIHYGQGWYLGAPQLLPETAEDLRTAGPAHGRAC